MSYSNQSLYQQALLSHHQSPVGFERDIHVTNECDGHNAACGDDIMVKINKVGTTITQLAFTGDSCAICRASASIMCQQVEHLTVAQYHQLYSQLLMCFQDDSVFSEVFLPLSSVAQYPIRQQCALLPWQTLTSLLSAIEEDN